MVAILAVAPLLRKVHRAITARSEVQPGWPAVRRQMLALLTCGYMLSGAIWMATAPLIAGRFHLVAPVGLLLNVPLLPVVTAALWSGFGLLVVGLLLPVAAPVFAFGCEWTLRLLLECVERAGDWHLGHFYVAGPGDWWLATAAALLIGAVVARAAGRFSWRWWIGPILLVLAALVWDLLPRPPGRLRCTFLAVGHGSAVIVEFPQGKTLLYDAGRLDSAHAAARTVREALWSFRRSRIDWAVVSHGDLDHFNALPELFRTVRLGGILCSRRFGEATKTDPACSYLRQAARQAQIPLRLVSGGEIFRPEAGVTVRFWQAEGTNLSDNESSLVLEIAYAGRKILLTGDLEGRGLDQLLNTPSRGVDILLAPHHGSGKANPPALAEWADPGWVVVSTSDRQASRRLRPTYTNTQAVLNTAEVGAVTFVIHPDGRIQRRLWAQRAASIVASVSDLASMCGCGDSALQSDPPPPGLSYALTTYEPTGKLSVRENRANIGSGRVHAPTTNRGVLPTAEKTAGRNRRRLALSGRNPTGVADSRTVR